MNEVRISRGMRRAIIALLFLVLIVGAGNLWATYALNNSTKAAEQRQEQAQWRAAQALERKLCTSLGKLAALNPPSGNPDVNPSRKYEQDQHAIFDQLGPDIGCGKKAAGHG